MGLKTLDEFSLHDAETLRLILRGDSIVDWHRLALGNGDDARKFILNHELNPDDPIDARYMEMAKQKAIDYLRRHFNFAIPKPVEQASVQGLLELASGSGHRQQCACTILKVVHIVNHLNGRELLFRLPVSDRDVFQLVEEKIYRAVGAMLKAGFPIKEFVGGRKNPDSTYSKLLSKPESSTVAIYDKLRFRLITHTRGELLPVLLYMTERLFPFNYTVPGQSTNTMLDYDALCSGNAHLREMVPAFQLPSPDDPVVAENRFSSPTYRTVQFVTEVPVRVPRHIMDLAPPGSEEFGPVIHVVCEIQVLDAETEQANESGDANHAAYKERQRQGVYRRLRLGARAPTDPKTPKG